MLSCELLSHRQPLSDTVSSEAVVNQEITKYFFPLCTLRLLKYWQVSRMRLQPRDREILLIHSNDLQVRSARHRRWRHVDRTLTYCDISILVATFGVSSSPQLGHFNPLPGLCGQSVVISLEAILSTLQCTIEVLDRSPLVTDVEYPGTSYPSARGPALISDTIRCFTKATSVLIRTWHNP